MGLRGDDTGKRRRHAGAGDNHLQAPLARGGGIFVDLFGIAVRRQDFYFIGNAEIVQRFRGIPHNVKVGLAADDDADKGGIAGHGDFLWLIRLWGRYRPSIRFGALGKAGNYRFPPALSKGRQQFFNHGVCYNPKMGSILVSISPGV